MIIKEFSMLEQNHYTVLRITEKCAICSKMFNNSIVGAEELDNSGDNYDNNFTLFQASEANEEDGDE
jgi:hypothetical protein